MISLIFATALVRAQEPARSEHGPEVTVYNQGFGLVKELRHLELKTGVQSLSLADVPSRIDPTSVAIRSITEPGSFDILEQNYQYDLVGVESILNKSVGNRVRLIRHFGARTETLEGTLVSPEASVSITDQNGFTEPSHQYNGVVLKLDDGRILLNPVGEIEVMSMPEGLISKPTLMWNLESRRAGDNLVELSYVANGMHWEASYVLTLDSMGGTASLQGWASVNNESGATYQDATLKLLAGDVHRSMTDSGNPVFASFTTGNMPATPPMREEQLFEYHLYTLQRPATVKDKEIKQLSLLESAKVPFKTRLVIDTLGDYSVFDANGSDIGTGNFKPQVRVEFANNEVAGLGIPLPAGKFRIYQCDASGSVQLLGEDSIEHTPKNEKISLLVGNSFDIVANRKRLSYVYFKRRQAREVFQIEVRNRKSSTEEVEILERHAGDWKVEATTEKYKKVDARTMQYSLILRPNEVRTIKYTIYTRWDVDTPTNRGA